ncbi:hypothetical protein ACSFC0_26115 [Serratia marcescens]|uniref:hypothetical protein n=1 Tax=Serratia marcescens TaxID=615 RepID=UPI003EDB2EF2
MWDVSSQDISRNWPKAAVRRAAEDGMMFSGRPIGPYTFHHSYAMHLLMNDVHVEQVQALMGHSALKIPKFIPGASY